MKRFLKIILIFIFASLVKTIKAEESFRFMMASTYSETADGEKQIEAALRKAKSEEKRVLVQFGGKRRATEENSIHSLFERQKTAFFSD